MILIPRRAILLAATLALASTAWAGPASPPDVQGATIPREMRAEFETKLQLIAQFMAAAESGRDGAAMSVSNTVWLRESLYRMSTEQIRSLGVPESYATAVEAVLKEMDARPLLGGVTTELVYYPITPCRYIDTRTIGGPLAGTRVFDLAFTGAAYGGSLGCDPKQVVGGNENQIGALAINVAIVSPTAAPGFIGVRPAQGTTTTALVNWWQMGAAVQASNAGIVSTNQLPGVPAEIEFFGSPTQFIVDIFGVFAAPTATAMDCVPGPLAAAVLTTSSREYSLTPGACTAGYLPLTVNCSASGGDFVDGHLEKSRAGVRYPGPAQNCAGYYSGASTVTVTAQATCCRMPGR